MNTKSKKRTAKLFKNGRSQAVRLPREFRFEGDCVSITRVPNGVLLQPIKFDVKEWYAELDRFRSVPFLEKDRSQPKTPRRDIFD